MKMKTTQNIENITNYSIQSLSDVELLTAALQSGSLVPQYEVAKAIMEEVSPEDITSVTWNTLRKFGVPSAKAATILSVIELTKRS